MEFLAAGCWNGRGLGRRDSGAPLKVADAAGALKKKGHGAPTP